VTCVEEVGVVLAPAHTLTVMGPQRSKTINKDIEIDKIKCFHNYRHLELCKPKILVKAFMSM